MEIKIDSDAAASIASAAIFDSLAQDARENMIKQALEHLMTPEKDRNRFGHGQTPLQQAFDTAVRAAAYKVVEEKIKNDPALSQAIYDLLGPLIKPALEEEAEHYDNGLADALGQALANWLGEKARAR